MTTYDFTGGGPQWGSVYSMGGQSQQNLLPHVSHAPPPQIQSPWDHSSPYRLTVKQQPERAKAANAKDKDRKPVDPPPILQLDVDPNQDPLQVYITSPYLFVQTFLIGANDSDPEPELNSLTGNTCTSGHVVKDDRGVHNMMFCLNDISVKKEGTYRLKFSLFKLNTATGDVESLTAICSRPFTTYSGRHFPGMTESTSMTRLLVDAGVRLRLRKESKAMSTKKKNNVFAQMMSRRGAATGGGGDDNGNNDDDHSHGHSHSHRPVKRMRSEPHDHSRDHPPSKHSSFSSGGAPPQQHQHHQQQHNSYNTTAQQQHSTPGSNNNSGGGMSAAHFPYHTTASPHSQNIMAPMQHHAMQAYGSAGGMQQQQQQLGLDTAVSHYHSPPSAGSSYQSPGGGQQSPSCTTGYPQLQLPPVMVDMGGGGSGSHHGSSSPDLNYTTATAGYHGGGGGGGYMPSAARTTTTTLALPGMQQQQQRPGSMGGGGGGPTGHMAMMRMGLQSGHGGHGESHLFEYGGYAGPRDGH